MHVPADGLAYGLADDLGGVRICNVDHVAQSHILLRDLSVIERPQQRGIGGGAPIRGRQGPQTLCNRS
jgi:hypothetical protein